MKLLVIDPIVNKDFDEMTAKHLKSKVSAGTEVEIVSINKGPVSVETYFDEMFAAPDVLRILKENEEKYDGFFINCFADVGVPAARELTSKPVLGAGEGSFMVTAMLGVPFSVVSIGDNARNKISLRLHAYGLDRFRSAVGIKETVLDLCKNLDDTVNMIVEYSRKEIEKYGSEAILLGCTGMAPAAKLVSEKLGFPVVEPGSAGIKALELLVGLGLSHSLGGIYCKAQPDKIIGY